MKIELLIKVSGFDMNEDGTFQIQNVSFNEVNYHFDTEEDEYVVLINLVDRISRKWEVSLGVVGGTPTDILNKGRHFRVMSTITKIINDFIDKYKPNFILIKPSKNDEYEEDVYNFDIESFIDELMQ